MARNKDYKGDGLIFAKAVSDKGLSVKEVMKEMNIAKGTVYNYYSSETLDDNVKMAVSKMIGVGMEELFGIKSNYSDENEGEELRVQLSANKEVITFGKQVYRRLRPDEYNEAFKDWPGVPMYNVPVTASFVATYRDQAVFTPQYYLHDPRFKDCNFGAIITGDSMHSEIRHGDFVVCQEVVDKEFVVFGDIYYVVAANGLETCKYLNADPKNENNFLLVPKNDKISPSPIPKKMIQKLYRVRGVLRGY